MFARLGFAALNVGRFFLTIEYGWVKICPNGSSRCRMRPRKLRSESWNDISDPGHPVNGNSDSASGSRSVRDDCQVAIAPNGQIQAHFWRGNGLNYVNLDELYFPASLCIGEVVADNPTAADAILAACRAFAAEESIRIMADGGKPYELLRERYEISVAIVHR